MLYVVPAVVVVLGAVFTPTREPNMNGLYKLSPTPGGTAERFPSQYRDYPGGVEFFDVYSPLISQLYSQVFWTQLEAVALPDEIVQRYAGKGMAIVGFEMDQVRIVDGKDVPVPISVVYNHHFEATFVGKEARLVEQVFDGPNDPEIARLERETGHRLPSYAHHYDVKGPARSAANGLPTFQRIGGANGGEVSAAGSQPAPPPSLESLDPNG
jgi:hypothetical protein